MAPDISNVLLHCNPQDLCKMLNVVARTARACGDQDFLSECDDNNSAASAVTSQTVVIYFQLQMDLEQEPPTRMALAERHRRMVQRDPEKALLGGGSAPASHQSGSELDRCAES
jgi:hypothetical protein